MNDTLRRWAPPLGLSVLVIALAPALGRVRDVLLEQLGARFLALFAGALALAGLVALGWAVSRVRGRWRWASLAVAALGVGAQLLWWQTGDRRVDVVERFHLVEYGALAALYYRAFAGRYRDAALPLLAGFAAGAVGVLDEFAQWATALRVGDYRDALLNLYAAGLGLFFAGAVAPPAGFRWQLAAPSRRAVLGGLALFVGVAGAFFANAHLGHEVRDEHTSFRSWFTAEELRTLAAERANRWALNPPVALAAYSREDYFLTEAARHVQERNVAWSRGDLAASFAENRILETWYPPFLDLHSMASGVAHRWPPEQRAAAEQAAAGAGFYRSPVFAGRIFVVPVR